ncbi:flavin reductase family protein [Pseudonocardia kujensis]|uniref:flavin reductase family protein n=1 Tax=Pseudonocardia kujensis TaxID=1128675 RepID=UPI001E2B5024|nr:flavin reductase family protein [Pseudonocardia kujensis]MCE0761431.1 flavin reductase family protein [Pseudonocardia kujensis]
MTDLHAACSIARHLFLDDWFRVASVSLHELDSRQVSEADFRAAMGSVCGPVTVVTAAEGGAPRGTTVSAFCSLSLRPPLVMVALDLSSRLLAHIRRSQRFGVNLLGRHQVDLARVFATKGDEKFAGVAWRSAQGVPRLDGAAGWLACDLDALVPCGDHAIVVGAVTDAHSADAEPLGYVRQSFGVLAPPA